MAAWLMPDVKPMGRETLDRDRFLSFLLKAKRATYAGQSDEATMTPLVPGSKQLQYRDGEFFYRDVYFGMAFFAGQEVVSHRGQAVWSMSYAGGVMPSSPDSDAREIYAFLRLALQRGTRAAPYRGPARFSRESLTYTNATSGSLEVFWGLEVINRDGQRVYELRYAGGFLR